MKKRIQQVFLELIKNSKKSDRDIAKKLKISQPTVTRIRKKLEKNAIKTYTTIPILPEIGINLISFNFARCDNPKIDIETCLKQIVKTNPQVLFRTSGEGMGKTCLIVALHTNYRNYVNFLANIRAQCKGIKAHFDSFVASTTKDHVLDFANPVTHLIDKK
ncbi:MAG: winged helix-turn-helix transcriptional regulator [Candidatus Aenigmarchaeota archaeon]|nr:winged helix-turn-helix transcriptional regulator [Candidatus Aenigmarchaeota archaeon]